MRAVFLYRYFTLFSILLLSISGCKKSEKFEAQPKISERPNYFFNPDSSISDTVLIEKNYLPVGYNLVTYISINAPGRIQQIDLQTFGNFEKISIENMKGDIIPLYQEPQWPNYTFKGPFDTETTQKYRIIINRVATKTTLAFIITDQNGLQTPIYFYYQPVELLQSLTNTSTLFSTSATEQDAGGSNMKKSYFSTLQNTAFTLPQAQQNPASVDFAFSTYSNIPYLCSADSAAIILSDTTKSRNVSGSNSISFAPTTLNINTATAADILSNIPSVLNKGIIEITTGQTYFFRAYNGKYGLIKITSLQPGTFSSKSNAEVRYNYVVTNPLN